LIRITNKKEANLNLRFSVIDTGIGISKPKIKDLFKSFTQADTSTTRKYGGTGLGLAISKNYVEMMGGNIIVNSKVNQGSTFIFEIPLKIAHQKLKAQHDKGSQEKLVTKGKSKEVNNNISILVVEDQPINLEIIVGLLKLKGYAITTACNGIEAVEKATSKKFDLIFMDVQMPEMDGLEATKKIREHELKKNTYTPIVAMTAHAMKGHKDQFIQIGMDDYIEKPLKAAIVYDTVNKTYNYASKE